MMKKISGIEFLSGLLILSYFILCGGGKVPEEKELTLEEVKAAELLDILENLEEFMDEEFIEKAEAINEENSPSGGEENEE